MGSTSFPKHFLWFLSVTIASQVTVSAVTWYPAKVGTSHLLGSTLDLPVANELSCAMKATKMANFNLWCYENERCSLYDQEVLPFTDHSGIETIVRCMTSTPIGNSSSGFSYSSTSSLPSAVATDATPSATDILTSTFISASASTTLTTSEASETLPETPPTTTSTTSLITTTLPDTTTESTAVTSTTTAADTTKTTIISDTTMPDTSTTTTVTTTSTTPTSASSTTTSTISTAGAIQNLCTQVENVGCIHLVETRSTWDDAEAGCENLGGHLYNADTEQQFLNLVSYISANDYPMYIWLGVKSRTWVLTSRPVSSNEWYVTEPNGNADYCGYLNKDMDYYLADFACSDPSSYLCQP